MSNPVRVRFAPSPTGELHLGGARTAIYNWAFARRTGGTFILRIDDTDPERSTPKNTAQILRSLSWLGLDWDEGPEIGGDSGPYFQTQRTELYRAALDKMIELGAAYPCFCSPETLAEKRAEARERGGFSGYDRTCRSIPSDEAQARIDAGEPFVWRLSVPTDRECVIVRDLVRGDTEFPCTAIDDFVLARSDRTPTYNFASAVDDVEMGITHVIRGDDHLANTPKQILVIEALGAPVPAFAHLSMIWGADGKKLSKRHGATSVEAYRDLGYLPEALLNYLALLGWSLDGETTVVTPTMLKEHFSLDRVSKNPAIFDPAKLEWLNGVYLREMPAAEFSARLVELLADEGLADAAALAERPEWFEMLAPLVSERIKLMAEAVPMVRFLFVDELEVDEKAQAKAIATEGGQLALAEALKVLQDVDDWDAESIEAALTELPAALELKPKVVFQAIRAAVTGSLVSPPLWESLELLGRTSSISRIDRAVEG